MTSSLKAIFASSLTAVALTLTAAGSAQAAYPDHPVQLVVPFAPGGASDVIARILAADLGKQLNQTVVVTNRAGAGTIIGAQSVAGATPDGYTLLISSNSTYTLNPALRDDLTFDTTKDFIPVGAVGTIPNMLIINANQPWKDVGSLISDLEAAPEKYVYGSYGTGTVAHFAGEMFQLATGTKMEHIAYRGSAPAMTDLISNQIPIAFDTIIASLPQIRSGKIRPLAMTSSQRSSLLPDVPTMKEAGYPDVVIESWLAIVAPSGTPDEAMQTLQAALSATLQNPNVVNRLKEAGMEPASTIEIPDWRERLNTEISRLKSVVSAAGISIN